MQPPVDPGTPAKAIEDVDPIVPANVARWQPRGPSSQEVACRAEIEELKRRNGVLATKISQLESEATVQAVSTPKDGVIELDDERVLQEVGIYRYHHPLDNADEFKERLGEIRTEIKDAVKQQTAVLVSDMFTFDNSLAKGRKMTRDLSKLMLRSYNAEADNSVRSLRAGNVQTAKKRLQATVTAIAKLGLMMEMRVSPEYHNLRIQEIELTGDYLMKKQEEKEEAREERARLREERRAKQELAAERERLDKERAHIQNALVMLAENRAEATETADLEARLRQLDDAIEQNDYRIANIRAGYVYLISNRGSFGPGIVKIGLTRRLEPMDRVRELGGASVPFPFEVHALFFSEDAVSLEAELHSEFAPVRVNHANLRREYFFATPKEVHEVLHRKVGNLLEFNERPEAVQYLQSVSAWPTAIQRR